MVAIIYGDEVGDSFACPYGRALNCWPIRKHRLPPRPHTSVKPPDVIVRKLFWRCIGTQERDIFAAAS
jgi:hypothetical protein